MSINRYLKIAEEKNFGEEAPGPYETIDPESAEIDPAEDDKLVWEGMSGLDRIAALGAYSTEGSFAHPFDDRVTPLLFKLALGGYEKDVDTHIIYPQLNTLMDSFTAAIGKDFMEHKFFGNAITDLELEVAEEWASLSVDIVGAKDAKGELEDTVTFTEGNVFAHHQVGLTREDTDITPQLDEMVLTIGTNADVEEAQGPGSRFPQRAYRGALEVNLEMTIGFSDDSELLRFWGNSDGPSEQEMSEAAYTLSLGENIDIILPRLIYTGATQPVSGREHISQTITARALVDQTVEHNGPIILQVTDNGVDSYDVDARQEADSGTTDGTTDGTTT